MIDVYIIKYFNVLGIDQNGFKFDRQIHRLFPIELHSDRDRFGN